MSLIETIDLLGVKEIANLATGGRRRSSRICVRGVRPITKDWDQGLGAKLRLRGMKEALFSVQDIATPGMHAGLRRGFRGLEALVLTQAENLAAG